MVATIARVGAMDLNVIEEISTLIVEVFFFVEDFIVIENVVLVV